MTPEPQHIRQYVDGELSPQDTAALEEALRSDAELRTRVAFERSLREAVGRAVGDQPAAPAGLRDEVRAALAACDLAEEAAPSAGPLPIAPSLVVEDQERSIRTAEQGAEGRRRSIFRNPTRINYLAVAACLAIVAGAVLFGIFGDPLLHQFQRSSEQTVSAVAQMAIQEHNRCVYDQIAQDHKLTEQDPRRLIRLLEARLGRGAPIFDLEPVGYALVGGGACGLPPTGDRSAHLMYRRASGAPGQVSIFMQPDDGQFTDLPQGAAFRPDDFQSCLQNGATCVFRHGGVVFFVIACDQADHPRIEEAIMAQIQPGDSSL